MRTTRKFQPPRHWTVAQRLAHHTEPMNERGCQVWTAAKDRDGYGKIHCEGRHRKAHRVAWELVNGSIPSGMLVLHRCDYPPCINPDHLFLGTNVDNMADKMTKGRHVVVRGEAHGSAKITAANALEIFVADGDYREIGDRFGISETQVRCIKKRKRWAHVSVGMTAE